MSPQHLPCFHGTDNWLTGDPVPISLEVMLVCLPASNFSAKFSSSLLSGPPDPLIPETGTLAFGHTMTPCCLSHTRRLCSARTPSAALFLSQAGVTIWQTLEPCRPRHRGCIRSRLRVRRETEERTSRYSRTAVIITKPTVKVRRGPVVHTVEMGGGGYSERPLQVGGGEDGTDRGRTAPATRTHSASLLDGALIPGPTPSPICAVACDRV
ncbi:hypothetical protein SKAU_G00402160 [Synaphobranchus kaupii]|uniref:Uncharacterized protein n=1 Tax=Synaphobranchus kaupii TaxID=118154 RepID=A0A9Q1ICH3_SYNKA|nr:hypothetical protein SKAU_G00402160 [Synaphobranchus kaupii]